MQSSKPRAYQDRPRRKKTGRAPPEAPAPVNPPDNRQRGRPPRYNRRDDNDTYYARAAPTDAIYVYRQDLLQKGFDVYQSSKPSSIYTNLAERYPECFTTSKRKVIIEIPEHAQDDPSFSQSRIQMREDLRENLGNLIDNEEIPDWFIDTSAPNSNQKPFFFDFGNTVSRTLEVNKEIVKRIDSNPVIVNQKPSELDEINFEELDNKIEQNYIKTKHNQLSSDDEEPFDLDFNQPYEHDGKELERHNEPIAKEHVSMNESSDCFNNLEHHIKKMLFQEKSGSEGEESEESFQESLGFEANRGAKPILQQVPPQVPIPVTPMNLPPHPHLIQNPVLPTGLNNPNPPRQQINLIQDLKSSIRPVEPYPPMQPVMSVNRALCDSLNNSQNEEEQQLKAATQNDETLKLTPAEQAQRSEAFLAKYGYLDPIMCQICYEILNSKRRGQMDKRCANGLNQKSVERFCSNKYKIFSMFVQGDLFAKVWYYKDKLGMINGPFTSYDMDIWNADPNYFSDDLSVRLDNSPFLNIKLWINRSSLALKAVEDYMNRSEMYNGIMQQNMGRAPTATSSHPNPLMQQPLPMNVAQQAMQHQPHTGGMQQQQHNAYNKFQNNQLPTEGKTSERKVSFQKKNDNDFAPAPLSQTQTNKGQQQSQGLSATGPQPQGSQPNTKGNRPTEELQRNFAELFPPIEEAEKAVVKQPQTKSKKSSSTKATEIQLIEALKSVAPKVETSDDKPILLQPRSSEPTPVPLKKDDKPSPPVKKEPEQDAQADPKKRGKEAEKEQKKPVGQPVPQPIQQSTQAQQRNSNKKGNQQQNKREENTIYVAKEPTPVDEPKKVPAKQNEVQVDQEHTANIKNLLGLHW